MFLQANPGESKLQQRLGDIGVSCESTLKVAADPVLVGIMRSYLGQDVRCATYSANTLLRQRVPGVETGAIWHVDYPYNNDQCWSAEEATRQPLGAQALICLDEFTAVNGGTMFYTNTHGLGVPPMQPMGAWGSEEKYATPAPTTQAALLQRIPNAPVELESAKAAGGSPHHRCEQLGRAPTAAEIAECSEAGFTDILSQNIAKHHPCPAGSALVAHSAWWHRQMRNYAPSGPGEDTGLQSVHPNRRTALLGNYCRGHVQPMKGAAAMSDQLREIRGTWNGSGNLTPRDKSVVTQLWQ
jgi:hypothetical protein